MTPHILVAGKLHPSGMALLERADVTYDYVQDAEDTSYTPLLGQADGLILRTQNLTADMIATAPQLKIVSRHGVGYDAVDATALAQRGIPLTIVGDVNSISVAEHTFTLILAASRRLLRQDQACRGVRPWEYRNALEGRDVHGKSLLIVGFGRIGRRLAILGNAFGMHVSAYDPFIAPDSFPSDVTKADDLTVAYSHADVISFHMPAAGAPLLGESEIRTLKSDCVVVNAARGGIVDDGALAAALREGRLQGAGIDVYADEPPSRGHCYEDVDSAILTPHSAGISRESAERMAVKSVQNILDYFEGTLAPELIVNGVAV